jgi:hypothetical protein
MEHGKKWTYVKYKCRCAACVTANAAYMTEYRRRNKAKILAKEKERYRRQKDAIIQAARGYYRREKDAIMAQRRTELGRTKRVLWEQARKARKLSSSLSRRSIRWFFSPRMEQRAVSAGGQSWDHFTLTTLR